MLLEGLQYFRLTCRAMLRSLAASQTHNCSPWGCVCDLLRLGASVKPFTAAPAPACGIGFRSPVQLPLTPCPRAVNPGHQQIGTSTNYVHRMVELLTHVAWAVVKKQRQEAAKRSPSPSALLSSYVPQVHQISELCPSHMAISQKPSVITRSACPNRTQAGHVYSIWVPFGVRCQLHKQPCLSLLDTCNLESQTKRQLYLSTLNKQLFLSTELDS